MMGRPVIPASQINSIASATRIVLTTFWKLERVDAGKAVGETATA